jgi:chromosome segregation ATPase
MTARRRARTLSGTTKANDIQQLRSTPDRWGGAVAESGIMGRLKRVEGDIVAIKTDVSVLKTDVSVLKTDVSVLKTDVSVLKTEMVEVKADIREIKTAIAHLAGIAIDHSERFDRVDQRLEELNRSMRHGFDELRQSLGQRIDWLIAASTQERTRSYERQNVAEARQDAANERIDALERRVTKLEEREPPER